MNEYLQAQNNYATKQPAYLGVQQTAAVPETPMSTIVHRLGAALEEASRLADRLSILECRLTGGGNVSGKDLSAPPRPTPTGHIGQINMTLDGLGDKANRANESVSRLLEAV